VFGTLRGIQPKNFHNLFSYTILKRFLVFVDIFETSLGVAEAPTPTAEPQSLSAQPALGLYITGTGIAVILAIAILGILILRKRP
jgi:hypothetical protein